VLADSAHPDMGPRLLAALPPKSMLESKAMQTWRRFLEFQYQATGRESYNAARAGHMIPIEEPEPVIEAIRALVNEVRGRAEDTVPPADGGGQAGHTPVVVSFNQRAEERDGRRLVHGDFRFTDAAGDATFVINKVTATIDCPAIAKRISPFLIIGPQG
jgi:hypothetical protein